ncbi:uncharacterized protein LOC142583721 [Dermacentor variabilis]|uniref:uncharacterized protein LOC142583721 n=1 Tax=Dermacentor variabilis TaxID=34621 RepID=UPI003F5B90CA
MYGVRFLTLDLSLQCAFRCVFIAANVNQPIYGSGFLIHFDLDVRKRRRRLVYSRMRLSISRDLSPVAPTGICTLIPQCPYARIHEDFPEVTRPCNFNHQPSAAEPTTLSSLVHPSQLVRASCSVSIRPSLNGNSSTCSSWVLVALRPAVGPAHSIWCPNEEPGDWCLCGDYRGLNANMVHDSYLISHI